MTFKTSFGVSTIAITTLVLLLVATIFYLIVSKIIPPFGFYRILSALLIFLCFFCPVLAAYLFHPTSYVLTDDTLVICRPFKSIKIPVEGIVDVFLVKKETMQFTERTGGNGGLFGFYGSFKTIFGETTFYATRLNKFLMIRTVNNERFIITPDDSSLLREIRKRLAALPQS